MKTKIEELYEMAEPKERDVMDVLLKAVGEEIDKLNSKEIIDNYKHMKGNVRSRLDVIKFTLKSRLQIPHMADSTVKGDIVHPKLEHNGSVEVQSASADNRGAAGMFCKNCGKVKAEHWDERYCNLEDYRKFELQILTEKGAGKEHETFKKVD